MKCPVQSAGNWIPRLIPVISAFQRQDDCKFKADWVAIQQCCQKLTPAPVCWGMLNKWEQKTFQRIALNFLI